MMKHSQTANSGPLFFLLVLAVMLVADGFLAPAPSRGEEWSNYYVTPRQIYDVAVEKKVCSSCDYYSTYPVVWCATKSGVFQVNPSFGTYTRHSYADGLAFNSTKVITVDEAGNKWIGTTRATDTNGLMSRFDDESWTTYRPPGASIINAITIDTDGSVWLGRGDFFSTMLGYGGISVFDGNDWTTYNTGNSGLVTDYVEAIALDAAGHKWIGTSAVALWPFNQQAGGVNFFDGDNWETYQTHNSDLAGEYVYDIAIDSQDNKWVATLHHGIFMYNDDEWFNYTVADGLPANEIQTLTIDSQDVVWFGTVGAGAGQYDGTALTVYNTENSGLNNDNVHAVAVCEPDGSCQDCGSVWFGTGNGLCRLNYDGWTSFPLGGITDTVYNDAGAGEDGRTWFATADGLIVYDGANWTTYDTDNSGLVSNTVTAVAVDADNKVWAGTEAGLTVYDGSAWTSYDSANSGLASNTVNTLAVTADNNIWAGTDSGLSRYDGSTWTTWDTADGLASDNITALAVADGNNVWAGSGAGLNHYDGGSWTVYDTANSDISADDVTALALDDGGSVWAGTEAGLNHYDGSAWTVYDTSNSALLSDDIRSLAVDDGYGQVWAGTPAGLHRFEGADWKAYECGDGVDYGTFTGMAVDPATDSVWFTRGGAGVSRVILSAPDQEESSVEYGDGDSAAVVDSSCFIRSALGNH
ncbi:MAG: two-component regulator propeller domain-containing protein [Desulfosudaceae bacterium]